MEPRKYQVGDKVVDWAGRKGTVHRVSPDNELTQAIWQAVFYPWWERSTWGARAWLATIG